MHGVTKQALTEEQKELKRKEREKKQERFVKGRDIILRKAAEGIFDEEGLRITAAILAANADIYVFWNYRKRYFDSKRDEFTVENTKSFDYFKDELRLTEECVRENPKSYGAWYHRQWILERFFTILQRDESAKSILLQRELCLCGEALKMDERNFHCWDHRRFVCKLADVRDVDELRFSDDKINENFSNYSAWHYRSALLPRLFPPDSENSVLPLQEKKLGEELRLVQNAFFTDPEDQSAWFYHSWLFRPVYGFSTDMEKLEYFRVDTKSNFAILSFTNAVRISEKTKIHFFMDEKRVEISETSTWRNADESRSHRIWISDFGEKENSGEKLKIGSKFKVFVDEKLVGETEIFDGENVEFFDENFRGVDRILQPKLPRAIFEALEADLKACRELKMLEQNNKWPSLTEILAMRSLDLRKYEKEILEELDSLVNVDPARRRFYEDLKSKFLFELKMLKYENLAQVREADLTKIGLTTLPNIDILKLCVGLRALILSDNNLTHLKQVGCLVNLEILDVDRNKLTTLNGLENLKYLKNLSVSGNRLNSEGGVHVLKPLKFCKKLRNLDMAGNDFEKSVDEEEVRKYLGVVDLKVIV